MFSILQLYNTILTSNIRKIKYGTVEKNILDVIIALIVMHNVEEKLISKNKHDSPKRVVNCLVKPRHINRLTLFVTH